MKTITTMLLAAVAALTGYAHQATAAETASGDTDTVMIIIKQIESYWVSEVKSAPRYPDHAVKRGEQGCATVGFLIEADGTTSGHWVIASHPEKIFDRSAIKASKKFTFTPGVLNNDREAVMTINTFTYMLATGQTYPGEEASQAMMKLCTHAAVKALRKQYGDSIS